jgi:hypothetical protein
MWRQKRTEKDQSSTKGKALETQSIGPLSDLSRLVWLNFCVAPKVGLRWALHFFRALEVVLPPEGSYRTPVSVAVFLFCLLWLCRNKPARMSTGYAPQSRADYFKARRKRLKAQVGVPR